MLITTHLMVLDLQVYTMYNLCDTCHNVQTTERAAGRVPDNGTGLEWTESRPTQTYHKRVDQLTQREREREREREGEREREV